MPKDTPNYITELKEKYKIDDCFYPNMSMDIDLSSGFEGEIKWIVDQLQINGIEVNSVNILEVMEFKKSLLNRYHSTGKGKTSLAKYNKILTQEIRPVGVTIPLDFLCVGGLTAFLLFLASKFLSSFMEESGKILAKKLFSKEENTLPIKSKMTASEYEFMVSQIIQLLEGEDSKTIIAELVMIAEKKTI